MADPKPDPDAKDQRTLVDAHARHALPEEPTLDGLEEGPTLSGPTPLSRLADYEIIAEVGRGGMGVVHRARHVKLGRTVALKMILGGSLARPDDLQRFEMEAAAAAQLKHPGIVSVYEVGCENNQPYFSMEFVSGSSLAQLTTPGPISGRRAAAYLEKTARAVHFAHQRGILHRDLKPANVLLDEQDDPKVTDFGLAKVLTTDSGQTRTGAVLGTPSYMSPEQAQGRKDIGPGADVYSLGAILYELLTGRPPFRGETALATLSLVANQEPVAPRLLIPSVDRDLETICLKCLEKDPKRRYASAEAFADDLHRYLEGEPISARRLSMVGRAVKWCRRRPAQAALLVMLATAVVGFVLFEHQNALQERELRKEAEEAQGRALLREKTMAYLLYHAHMRRTQQALENADWDRAENLLDTWSEPKSNLSDIRDWEWFFLKARCGSRFSIPAHNGSATAIAYRPDGKHFASAGGEPKKPNSIKIWDAHTGKEVLNLSGHADKITSLGYSGSDNQSPPMLASCGFDGLVKVWDLNTGTERWSLSLLPGHLNSVCFSPDGRWIAAASSRGIIALWDLHELERGEMGKPKILKAHVKEASSLAFAPDSALLVSGGFDGVVKLWDLRDDSHTSLNFPGGEVHCVAFSPQGKFVAAGGGARGGRNGQVRFWHVEKRELRFSRTGLSDSILSLSFGPTGKLAAAGNDGLIHLWDQPLSSEARVFRGDNQLVYAIALSPNGHHLACAGHSGRVTLHNTTGGLETQVLPLTSQAEAIAFDPSRRVLAVGSRNGNLMLWALDPAQKPAPLPGAGNTILSLAFSSDGRFLAAGCADQFIRIFDLKQPDKPPRILTAHALRTRSVAFSPDGKYLASASDIDDTIRLWNHQTGELACQLSGHVNGILSIAYSPDGRYLASGSYDKTVRVWDLASANAKRDDDADVVSTLKSLRLEGHRGSVNGVAFNADGSMLASVSSDRTLRLWDLNDDNRVQVFEGSPGPLFCVAFHPQGRRLATIGQDKTIRLWDVVARQEILELEDVDGGLRQITFSTDGRYLAVAGQSFVRVWDAGRSLLSRTE